MIKKLGSLDAQILEPYYAQTEQILGETHRQQNFFNRPRFYSGPACSNYDLWHFVEVLQPAMLKWYESIASHCENLLCADQANYKHLREAMLVHSGIGQSNKPFFNTNWLNLITKRVHLILRGSGSFSSGDISFPYVRGDLLLVDLPDKAKIIHKFEPFQSQLVFSFGLEEHKNIRSWDLFAQHHAL